MHCSPIPFFISVVILSRCSPLFFFHEYHALYFRHSHNYDNCGQSGHAWSGSFRRSRNSYITDKGIKSLLEFQLDLLRLPPEQYSKLICQCSPVRHGSQQSEYLLCRTVLLINSRLRCCSFSVRSLAEVDSRSWT